MKNLLDEKKIYILINLKGSNSINILSSQVNRLIKLYIRKKEKNVILKTFGSNSYGLHVHLRFALIEEITALFIMTIEKK